MRCFKVNGDPDFGFSPFAERENPLRRSSVRLSPPPPLLPEWPRKCFFFWGATETDRSAIGEESFKGKKFCSDRRFLGHLFSKCHWPEAEASALKVELVMSFGISPDEFPELVFFVLTYIDF